MQLLLLPLLLLFIIPYSSSFHLPDRFFKSLHSSSSSPENEYFEVTKPLSFTYQPSCTLLVLQQDFGDTMGSPPSSVVYSPPWGCPGPWSHVVLELSGSCRGEQYDRIVGVWLGGVEMLRSSTPEPNEGGVLWKVRKDVGRYSSVLMQSGLMFSVMLENIVNDVFTGVYKLNVSLLYYYEGGIPPPSVAPSAAPVPLMPPSLTPSETPSMAPTVAPSLTPSMVPSVSPSVAPSLGPSLAPSPSSMAPSSCPSAAPSTPSLPPSLPPSMTPSLAPLLPPSMSPPSLTPSLTPSLPPSMTPSLAPLLPPSMSPPSLTPSLTPSLPPSMTPSLAPLLPPSMPPLSPPSLTPSLTPSLPPSSPPSMIPSAPSFPPLLPPSMAPSPPSSAPSLTPSLTPPLPPSAPSFAPSLPPPTPSSAPSLVPLPPSFAPLSPPSSAPSFAPSFAPIRKDTAQIDQKIKLHKQRSEDSLIETPADLIIPISDGHGDQSGFWFKIQNESDVRFKEISIPLNTYKAVLEIYVSFHGNDEFWYSNPPNSYIEFNNLTTARGNGAFREVVVTLDGVFVGSILPFPVIFTGGINPLFWEPVVSIGAFDLPSYDLHLSPFLGLLLDGKTSHLLGIGVTESIPFWLVDANLHLWLDSESPTVVAKTVSYANPAQSIERKSKFRNLDGKFKIDAERQFEFCGWVNSSLGNLTTHVSHQNRFESKIKFKKNGQSKNVKQNVRVETKVKVQSDTGELLTQKIINSKYPLHVQTSTQSGKENNTYLQNTKVSHNLHQTCSQELPTGRSRSVGSNNQVSEGWMVVRDHSVLSGNANTKQTVLYSDDAGCYSRTVYASNGTLLEDTSSLVCATSL